VLGEGVKFYHRGNIVINPNARVGEGCKFHGNCCIGIGRDGEEKCPIIGKNVDIGFGAVLLGDIKIADNIVIGANSVVTRSFDEPGIVIAGVPARKIKDA
jgi:serine O-acetyltransferase